MGGINLSVHPLFFLFGFYYALTGRIFIFIIYTVTAVVHELGHSFEASKAGYRLNKVTLMPFGAVVSGDIDGLKFTDEVKIALAGPLINIAVGTLFIASWWIYPETYAFTDVIAEANFSMAIVNLLPIYPLDGGRVLFASISERFGSEKAFKINKIIGGIFALILFACFIATIFYQINLSLLFFSAFVLFGVFGKGKENKYVRIYTAVSEQNLLRGMCVKKYAFSKDVTVKKLMSAIDETSINEVVIYDGDKEIALLKQKKITEIIEKGEIYQPIYKFL